jgi:hypothetical protein
MENRTRVQIYHGWAHQRINGCQYRLTVSSMQKTMLCNQHFKKLGSINKGICDLII